MNTIADNNKAVTEGSKYFELGRHPHEFLTRDSCVRQSFNHQCNVIRSNIKFILHTYHSYLTHSVISSLIANYVKHCMETLCSYENPEICLLPSRDQASKPTAVRILRYAFFPHGRPGFETNSCENPEICLLPSRGTRLRNRQL